MRLCRPYESMTNPSSEQWYTVLALSLHGSLDGINRRQDHPEACRGHARENGFDEHRELAHKGVALQESKNTCVGCGIAKARHRSLNECGTETLIVPRPTTVCIQRLDRFRGRRAVAVLIVHDRPQGLWGTTEYS